MISRRLLPAAFLLAIAGAAAAQQQPADSTKPKPKIAATALSELVVTAARTTQRAGDSPANITVISKRDLTTASGQNVSSVLSRIPGYSTRDYQNPVAISAARSAPSFRGLGNSTAGRTLVLYDGVPFNEPASGQVYWARLPLALVQRIEAVRGGSSMIWGSRALGGVINIMTRRPDATRFDAEFEGGEHGEIRGAGDIAVSAGKLSAMVAGSASGGDGFRAVKPDQAGPIDGGIRTSQQMLLGKVDYQVTPALTASLSANYFREWHRGPTPADSGPASVNEIRGGLRYATSGGGVLTFAAYGNHRSSLITNTNIAADRASEAPRSWNETPSNSAGSSLQYSRAYGAHSLTSGTDWSWITGHGYEHYNYVNNVVTSERITHGHQVLGGMFVQDGWALNPKVHLQGGVRVDWVRNGNGERREMNVLTNTAISDSTYAREEHLHLSFSVGLRHELNSWLAWRASGYEAFRAPMVTELYRPTRSGGRAAIVESNPGLRSEKLRGLELGADFTLSEAIFLRLGGFWNRVIDPIVDATVGVATANNQVIQPCGIMLKDQPCRERRNVGTLRSYGVESELEVHPAGNWSVWSGYTFNPTRFRVPGQVADGKSARGAARHIVTAMVSWEDPRILGVTVEGRYVGNRFDDDLNTLTLGEFSAWGLRLNRKLVRGSSAYLKVENLFNRHYEVTKSTSGIIEQASPRWVTVGLRATW